MGLSLLKAVMLKKLALSRHLVTYRGHFFTNRFDCSGDEANQIFLV